MNLEQPPFVKPSALRLISFSYLSLGAFRRIVGSSSRISAPLRLCVKTLVLSSSLLRVFAPLC